MRSDHVNELPRKKVRRSREGTSARRSRNGFFLKKSEENTGCAMAQRTYVISSTASEAALTAA